MQTFPGGGFPSRQGICRPRVIARHIELVGLSGGPLSYQKSAPSPSASHIELRRPLDRIKPCERPLACRFRSLRAERSSADLLATLITYWYMFRQLNGLRFGPDDSRGGGAPL